MSDLLYTVFTQIDPEYEDEFNEWQEREHCPLLLTCPGYFSVSRFKCMDMPYYYTNFWHIEDKRFFDTTERREKAMGTPWGMRLSPYRHRHIDFYQQDDGLNALPPSAETDDALTYLVIDQYTDAAGKAQNLTEQYRGAIPELKTCSELLDAKIYHSYEGLGTAENFVFYYLSCTESEMNSLFLPKLDRAAAGTKQYIKNRACYQCIGKWKADKG